jgi:hypothetical protein
MSLPLVLPQRKDTKVPRFEIFQPTWGNILVTSVVERKDAQSIVTIRWYGNTASGESSAILDAIRESKSEDDLARICRERFLMA